MSFPSDLPDNIDALKAMLVAAEAQISTQDQALADRDAVIECKEDRIIRLEKLLSDFKRALYGAKSEKGDPDQYHLALEDIETAMAVVHAEDERHPLCRHITNRQLEDLVASKLMTPEQVRAAGMEL